MSGLPRARTWLGLAIVVLLVALIVAGALSSSSTPTGSGDRAARGPVPPTATAQPKEIAAARKPRTSTRGALVALEALPVQGRAPKTGYSRERFGDGWATVAGCDVRDRILARDLTGKIYGPGNTCAVRSGHLDDPYTAAAITFVRGGASEVDIDHVVALSDAWQKGAQGWTAGRRAAFANDPLNLLSVDAHTNRAKGDGDAATWLPPNDGFRCGYVARQVAVKRKYHAWLTPGEHDAIARVLATCPAEKLPAAAARASYRSRIS